MTCVIGGSTEFYTFYLYSHVTNISLILFFKIPEDGRNTSKHVCVLNQIVTLTDILPNFYLVLLTSMSL